MLKHDENGFILGEKHLALANKRTQSIHHNTQQILAYLQGLKLDELQVMPLSTLDDVRLDEPQLPKTLDVQPKQERQVSSYQAKSITYTPVRQSLALQLSSSSLSTGQLSTSSPPQVAKTKATKHMVSKQQELKRQQYYDNLTERHQLEKRRILRAMVYQPVGRHGSMAMLPMLPKMLGSAKSKTVMPQLSSTPKRALHRSSQSSFGHAQQYATQLPQSTLLASMLAPQAKSLTDEAGQVWHGSITGLSPIFAKMVNGLGRSFQIVGQSIEHVFQYFGLNFMSGFQQIKAIFKQAMLAIPFLGGMLGGDDTQHSSLSSDSDLPVGGSKQQQAMQFFINKGWSKAQSAGIVANLMVESGNFADDVISGKRLGDSGRAYGIAQWHPDRQAKFKQVFGKDIRQSSFADQLAFVDWELNNSERGAGNQLKATQNAYQAGAVVSKYYERPLEQSKEMQKRGTLAEQVMGKHSPIATTQRVQQRLGAYYIGDSLAVGAGGLGGDGIKGQAVKGLNPKQVLQNMQNLGHQLQGQNVVLSSGLSNNVQDIASVEKQLQYLKSINAKVTLMGVSYQWDHQHGGQLNAQLNQLAKRYGAVFDGGFQAGRDGVHASQYAISQKQQSLGSIFKMKTANLSPLPKDTAQQTASHVRIKVDNPTLVGERDFVHRV